jgi:ABC-type Na+ transport system ATPase subunit NatA
VRILATLLRPDGGTTTVGGLDVVRHAAQVRRLIGLTGQYASVDEDLTGTENLVLIGRLLDLRGAEAKARAAVGRCAAWQRHHQLHSSSARHVMGQRGAGQLFPIV